MARLGLYIESEIQVKDRSNFDVMVESKVKVGTVKTKVMAKVKAIVKAKGKAKVKA